MRPMAASVPEKLYLELPENLLRVVSNKFWIASKRNKPGDRYRNANETKVLGLTPGLSDS